MLSTLIAVIALGGCSGSDATTDPTTTATPTTGPTSPTSPPTTTGPTEPVLPAAARKPGRSGAEAFVRYYIRLLNYAAHTGDTKTLRARSHDCRGCERYADLYTRTYRRGGAYFAGDWLPTSLVPYMLPSAVTVLVLVDAKPGSYRPRSGAAIRHYKADHYSLRFQLDRLNGQWSASRLEGQ